MPAAPVIPAPPASSPAIDAAYPLLHRLLAAEAAAEAPPGTGIDPADLEQTVWLRLLELGGTAPAEPDRWLRRTVSAEARAAAGRLRGELPYDDGTVAAGGPPGGGVEDAVLAAERRRTVASAVRALPGRCPQVVTALMSPSDPTYRQISRELGISQGSIGPLRSRCLGCLQTVLKSRVGSPV